MPDGRHKKGGITIKHKEWLAPILVVNLAACKNIHKIIADVTIAIVLRHSIASKLPPTGSLVPPAALPALHCFMLCTM